MFLVANLLTAVARILGVIFDLALISILVRVVLSWVNADPYHPLVRTLFALTEPLLSPFRRLAPLWRTGGLDLSPLLAMLTLELLEWFLIPSLYDIASRIH